MFPRQTGNDANDGQKMTEITYLHIEMNLFYVHLIMYSDMWKLLCVEYSHMEQANAAR